MDVAPPAGTSRVVRSRHLWRSGSHRLAAGVALYFISGLITFVAALWLAQAPDAMVEPLVVLIAGISLPISLRWPLASNRSISSLLQILIGAITIAAMALAWSGASPSLPYGDGQIFGQFVASAYAFPRWLVGAAVSIWLYVGFWTFPSVAAHLPAHLRDSAAFLRLLCPAVMGIGSIAILRQWPHRLAAIIPMLIPIWWLFLSGYVEYYPLIMGAWLASLLWIFEQPLGERSAYAVGALAGILPALYAGFAGLSVLLVVSFVLARPSRAIGALLSAAASLAVSIAICWPTGIPSYLHALAAEMNFGEQHIGYARYVGRSGGPSSIFFSTHYAFVHTHLIDLAYMLFWGTGWLVPLLLVGGIAAAIAQKGGPRGLPFRDVRIWLGVGLGVWQIYYFIYMIPRLGPTADIDLFCPTYVTLAFLAGELLDRTWPDCHARHAAAYPILCALLGILAVASTYLAWIGLPARL